MSNPWNAWRGTGYVHPTIPPQRPTPDQRGDDTNFDTTKLSFGINKTCPKCGGEVKVTYCDGERCNGMYGSHDEEKLHAKCKECSYKFLKNTLSNDGNVSVTFSTTTRVK